jgi:hypothetical protein
MATVLLEDDVKALRMIVGKVVNEAKLQKIFDSLD